MQSIKLNLIPGSVLPVVNVSQYDAHRQFQLVVYEGATAYSLTGKDAQIRGTKPDGNGFAYDATDGVVSVSGNTVTISTTQQMTAVGGQTMAELRITSGDTILGTLNFVLMVEPSALSDDTPISETDIPVIERDFEAALEEAQEAAETATTQAGIATTKAGEAATSATNAGNSATTASNAATTATTKAGEASTSATNAGNSATAAAADSLEAEGWAVGEQGGTPVGPTSPYYQNNAAYYAAQAGQYATGGLIFKGSVAFANIPTTGMVNGDMYNITDDFTTDSRFIEGAGVAVKAGADIAFVAGSVNKWDILALGGGGGADALDDLTDVELTSPAEGDLLQRNGNGEWVNSAVIPQKVAGLQKTGCVNVMQNTAISSVDAGISYVVNADKTVSASGLSTDVSAIYTCGTSSQYVKNDISGPFKFVGSPTVNGVRFVLRTSSDGVTTTGTYEDFGSGVIVPDAPYIKAYIRINNGVNLTTPALFKPMLTPDLSATYADYQPYSMTNRELTEEVIDLSQRGGFDGFSGAGFHNSLYRGKALGGAVSTEQWAAISAGTFDDLFIGDYWTIGGINYRIAAFDYWLRCGDTECTTHHVVLVPDKNLYNAKMNDTNITTGGYTGSKMYTNNLASAKTKINTAFGSAHILSHKELLVNATASGSASGCTSFASTVELMSESMVYGHNAWAANTSASGLGYETSIDKGQLPLFALEPSRICNRSGWWLRDVVSSTYFAYVGFDGSAYRLGAGASDGVRPVFGIIG